jgi:hypothetical protein
MIMLTELRDQLERDRRAQVQRQIAALEGRLAQIHESYDRPPYLVVYKLRSKIRHLYRELAQPMLFTLSRRGGMSSET